MVQKVSMARLALGLALFILFYIYNEEFVSLRAAAAPLLMLFEVTTSFESFVADAASEGRLHVAALDVIDQTGFALCRVCLAAGLAA